jgi:predicted GNAT family acetyltransferase
VPFRLVRRPAVRVTLTGMEHAVQHHESGSKGAFYIAGASAAHLAQMTYSRTSTSLIIIDHTDVDPSLAGQGIGRKLLGSLVDWARGSNTKVIPLCPFAKAQFEKDASLRDVLAS